MYNQNNVLDLRKLKPPNMETAIIIVLAFMLLIAIIILIDIRFDIKRLNIKIRVLNSSLDKSKNQNKFLRSNNDNIKKAYEEQERKFKEYKKYSMDSRDSKITELETKYQSALKKIVERDEKIRLKDSEILKYDKCNKQISEELIKKNNVIEDSYTRIKNMDQEKQCAINERNKANQEKQWATNQRNNAMHMANEMAKDLVYLNSQIELVELEINRKVNP